MLSYVIFFAAYLVHGVLAQLLRADRPGKSSRHAIDASMTLMETGTAAMLAIDMMTAHERKTHEEAKNSAGDVMSAEVEQRDRVLEDGVHKLADGKSKIKQTVDAIYYINLNRSADRRISMEKQLANLSSVLRVERWPATDKRSVFLSPNTSLARNGASPYMTNLKAQGRSLSGVVACFESHAGLISHIGSSTSNDDIAIVFEDDVILKRHWFEHLSVRLQALPEDWVVFRFGFDKWTARIEDLISKDLYLVPAARAYAGTLGYAVNGRYAALLADRFNHIPVMDADCVLQSYNKNQNITSYEFKAAPMFNEWKTTGLSRCYQIRPLRIYADRYPENYIALERNHPPFQSDLGTMLESAAINFFCD